MLPGAIGLIHTPTPGPGTPPIPGTSTPLGPGTPPGPGPPRQTDTVADGTHPTGMHSFLQLGLNIPHAVSLGGIRDFGGKASTLLDHPDGT